MKRRKRTARLRKASQRQLTTNKKTAQILRASAIRRGFLYVKGGSKICSHKWSKHNDVSVCVKCGLTVTYDGKMFFDKKITTRRKIKNGKSGDVKRY